MSAPEAGAVLAKQQRWTLLVTELVASFDEIVRLANRHPRDLILSDLKRRAEAGKASLLAHEPYFPTEPHGYGSLGEWGQNGRAPAIRQMLRQAVRRGYLNV